MVGAGGHARVLQESLSLAGIELHGFVAPTSESRLRGIAWLGTDDALESFDVGDVLLVNGVGSAGLPAGRQRVYELATARGFSFATVIDVTAIVRPSAELGNGAQVLAGAIVGTGVVIGADVIVNSGAIVEHDSVIGDHGHISPGAAIAGDVNVGAGTHVGLGARVIQGVSVGSQCVIGAGAVVITGIPAGSIATGVPATSRPRT